MLKGLGRLGRGREGQFGHLTRQFELGTGRRNMSTKTVAVLAADELKDGQMYALPVQWYNFPPADTNSLI